jgi:predicted protein tyrosine phosphatase
MKLIIYGRYGVKNIVPNYTNGNEFAAISITTVDDDHPIYPENPDKYKILHIFTDDFDINIHKEYFIEIEKKLKRPVDLFSKEDAVTILNFVNECVQHNKDITIVCQCDAGVSRSAGVAAALSKIYNDDDEYIFKKYVPNRYVYRMILETHFENEYQ